MQKPKYTSEIWDIGGIRGRGGNRTEGGHGKYKDGFFIDCLVFAFGLKSMHTSGPGEKAMLRIMAQRAVKLLPRDLQHSLNTVLASTSFLIPAFISRA